MYSPSEKIGPVRQQLAVSLYITKASVSGGFFPFGCQANYTHTVACTYTIIITLMYLAQT